MVSLHQLCPSLRTRNRAQQAPVISRLRRTKTFPGIARFARSGSSPGAASWFAWSADITCPARTIT